MDDAKVAEILREADQMLHDARSQRDAARREAAELREELRLSRALTAEVLMRRIDISGLGDDSRLLVMAQNPADNHHWSRSVGRFTAGELRDALTKAGPHS